MIISTVGEDLLVIRQTDHAALSGELATHWGNATFAPPEPAGSVLPAAALHDNGWEEWEGAPRLDPRTGRPYLFYELPPEEHLALYRRGVDRVVARDAYAGLLVNLHCTGLYRGRYGIDTDIPTRQFPPETRAAVDEALAGLDEQAERLRAELSSAGVLDESRLWANYKLLQVFDRLSLYLCMLPVRERDLGPAPAEGPEREVRLRLRPDGSGRVAVEPYPFGPDPFRVQVTARRVPDRRYANDMEFRQALHRAGEEILAYDLHS